ncbi:MAG: alanine racemase [Candidatus Omnitrophota bacterium]
MNKNSHIGYRPTWAEIKLGNLTYNLNQVRKKLSASTKVMVTIKADAYGHGLIPIARRLVSDGVDFFGVASIDEGIKLRKAGVSLPILILGLVLKNDIKPVFRYKLTPTVCDEGLAFSLNNKARALGRPVNVHIKVDTGMGRIGVLSEDAEKLVGKVHKMKFINIEGIFTHFAFADMNKEFTSYQINLFKHLIQRLNSSGINIPLVHAANSIALIDYKVSHFNMARPGLVVYGLYPAKSSKIKLKPVLSLKTKVVFVKKVPVGYGISYGHDYVTKRETRIATLPIGYGDGYPRNLSGRAPVLIGGRRFKICGRICMDQIMVDVGNFPVKAGDEVVLIGSQGRNNITTEELARLSGTIPYEFVCGLGSRIPRIYIN